MTQKDTKKCPHCNANIPFLSNVCPYCGNKIELESTAISKEQIINNIKLDIDKISRIKPASTFQLFAQFSILIFAISFFFAFFATAIFHSNTGVYVVIASPIAIIISIIIITNNSVKNKLTKSINQTIDNIKSSFSKNQSLFNIYDPKNPEIKNFAENFTKKVITLKQQIWQRTRNAVILNIILLLTINFYLFNINKNTPKVEFSNTIIQPTYVAVSDNYSKFIAVDNAVYSYYIKETITNKDTVNFLLIDVYLKNISDNTRQNFPNKKISLFFADNSKNKQSNMPQLVPENEIFNFNNDNIKSVRFEYKFKNKQEINNFIKNINKNPNMIISFE